MRKYAFRALLMVSLGLVLVFGFGPFCCIASEPAAAVPETGTACVPVCRCEPVYAIVACGECNPCDTRDIPLCPPARTPQTPTIVKTPVIDFVQVLDGAVRVFAHVDKLITYVDITGTTRTRFVRVPFECNIPIPGIVSTDTVAAQSLTITSEVDVLSSDGRSLCERLCVRISVSIQRLIGCNLVCPGGR